MPAGKNKVMLADGLAHLATEGDPGRSNLQAVTDTLAASLADTPMPEVVAGHPSDGYVTLAKLARYEGMTVSGPAADAAQYKAAAAALQQEEAKINDADFTLRDLHGRAWTLKALKGKVVLVNFWATWCPPCRVELPNLDAIADHYSHDLVVLAVTDEDAAKVDRLLGGRTLHMNVLLDGSHEATKRFKVESLPATFVFDREGKLAAEAVDGRTQQQFLAMLRKAGLQL